MLTQNFRIYRLVLVQEDILLVSPRQTPPLDPPLLRTCRQIRLEARRIFYNENSMIFDVVNLDISKLVRWLDLSPAHDDLCRATTIRFFRTPGSQRADGSIISTWNNLLAWVKLYCQHRCRRIVDDPMDTYLWLGAERFPQRAVEVFDLVDKLLEDDGMTMRKLHVRLEEHRRTVLRPQNFLWSL